MKVIGVKNKFGHVVERMPKFDARGLDQELARDRIWPVVWIYGPEPMKARPWLRRFEDFLTEKGRLLPLNRERFEAVQPQSGEPATAAQILDAAQTVAFGGGVRWIEVWDAHKLKDPQLLAPLLREPMSLENPELTSICVFRAKELDQRTKWAKVLMDKAALFPCDPVLEHERKAWIGLLMKRMGMDTGLRPEAQAQLLWLEPWTLDRVESELEKWRVDAEAEVAGVGSSDQAEKLVNAILAGRKDVALSLMGRWSEEHAENEGSHLLVGLLAWHLRSKGAPGAELLRRLAQLDVDLKTSFRSPKAAWREFVVGSAS